MTKNPYEPPKSKLVHIGSDKKYTKLSFFKALGLFSVLYVSIYTALILSLPSQVFTNFSVNYITLIPTSCITGFWLQTTQNNSNNTERLVPYFIVIGAIVALFKLIGMLQLYSLIKPFTGADMETLKQLAIRGLFNALLGLVVVFALSWLGAILAKLLKPAKN